jgi:hypothetical protein
MGSNQYQLSMPLQVSRLIATIKTTISQQERSRYLPTVPMCRPPTRRAQMFEKALRLSAASCGETKAAPATCTRKCQQPRRPATGPRPWQELCLALCRMAVSTSNQDMASCCQSTTPCGDVQASDAAQVVWRRGVCARRCEPGSILICLHANICGPGISDLMRGQQ